MAVKSWIAVVAWFHAGAWALSAAGALTPAGFAALAGLGALAGAFCWRRSRPQFHPRRPVARFRRPFPLAFLLLALLAGFGALLHAPNNYDALTYRLPRVLNWLAAEQWHWISTLDPRLNTRVNAHEWLLAPLLSFTRSDRALFLVNWLPFLLLPGLIFSVWTRLDVRPRVAWAWMWLLPSGYGFLLQAGSIGNDLFGAAFALAAVDFALRARQTRRFSDLAFSVLAAALLTSTKLSNLPLLLPWLLAVWPALRLARQRRLASTVVLLLAAVCSFAPSAALNLRHGGDWTGTRLEEEMRKELDPHGVLVVRDPLVGVAGNTLSLFVLNLAPPFLPWARTWNANVAELFPATVWARIRENFEIGYLNLNELPQEEAAGLGFGVSLLLGVSVLAATLRRCTPPAARDSWLDRALVWSPWIALLYFMTKSGTYAAARIVLPYYALLLPALLRAPGHAWLVRRRAWKRAGFAVFALSLLVLAVTPSRPLWPAQTILGWLAERNPDNRLVQRAATAYAVYAGRNDAWAPIRALLPADAHVVGLVGGGDDAESSLWRPFGRRRVRHILPADSPMELRRAGVHLVVVSEDALRERFRATLEDWLARVGGTVIARAPVRLKASREASDWLVVRLEP